MNSPSYTPSPDMIRENDKKYLLPSDYENKYDINLRRERAKSNINTFKRIFTINQINENENYNDNDNSNTNSRNNYFFYRPEDSMDNLISYKYAPNFREVV
jgi:hypothetical protein